MRFIWLICALSVAAGASVALRAQEGEVDLTKVAAAKKEVKKKPIKRGPEARQLFGAAKTPAPLAARAIGFYAKGCLSGAAALPTDGPAWQAMRLSRNRNWGHPKLVALVEKLALEAKEKDGWPGLLVGDLSQPRGGPMLTGHASHQVGLDADIWLTPMPDRRLSEKEREDLSATSMLAPDQVSVDPNVWTDAHVRLLKRAASYPGVERIFVHPAIKKALCEADAKDAEPPWTRKIRAYWGHHYHFHVRIACPEGSGNCEAQQPLPADDGCGDELKRWLALVKPKPQPTTPTPPAKSQPVKRGLTLDQLPAECRSVLSSGTDAPLVAAKPPAPAKAAPPAPKAPPATAKAPPPAAKKASATK
jgi:penicillin-insensitive murein DD-endopeptidase